jgi:hypothetical protein
MNPYLEHEFAWKDFHARSVPVIAELIAAQVGDAYDVMVDEHLYIHEPPAAERRRLGRADASVAVGEDAGSRRVAAAAMPAPATAVFSLPVDVETVPYVEVRDREGAQIVTVIELLSPANKRSGGDREQYLHKRKEVLLSSAHFVEIDLLRGGPRLPADGLPLCDYYAAVSRVEERPKVGVWPVRLRDRLPPIPIPLTAPDPDVRLDLQAMLDLVYDRARYGPKLYRRPIVPPLAPEDAGWAKQFVPTAAG